MRSLPRLYITHNILPGKEILLDKPQAHYLETVLRKAHGDCVHIFNGVSGQWMAELKRKSKKQLFLVPKIQVHPQPEKKQLELVFAPIKLPRLKILVEKATEIGVTDFKPILTQNTHSAHFPKDKLEKIAQEASEQSGRLDVPQFHDGIDLKKFIPTPQVKYYFFYENSHTPFDIPRTPQHLGCIIGPEGGFRPEEVHFLKNLGISDTRLGPTILRAETAAILGLGLLHLRQ